MRIGVALRVLSALLVVATGLTVLGATTTQPAAASTPFTFLSKTFNEASFPPTGWSTTDGNWSSSCSVVSPETGCAFRTES